MEPEQRILQAKSRGGENEEGTVLKVYLAFVREASPFNYKITRAQPVFRVFRPDFL